MIGTSNQSFALGPKETTARFLLLLSFMAAGRPVTCPLCGSQHLIRLSDEEVPGTTTVVVRYLCDKCHAVFTRQPVKAASQEIARSPSSVARGF
jgi:transposase-like protein